MHRSNVLKFPTETSNGRGLKIFAVLFYVLLALTMVDPRVLFRFDVVFPLLGQPTGLTGDSLYLLIVLGTLYGLGVRHRAQAAAYWRRSRLAVVLLGIILVASVWRYLPVLVLMGLAYWLLIGRTGRESPYFLRFHLLTALVLDGLLALPLLIFQAVMGLFEAMVHLFHLSGPLSPLLAGYGLIWVYVTALVFWVPAVWLSFSAIMGRTPYIKIVTSNVRHWA